MPVATHSGDEIRRRWRARTSQRCCAGTCAGRSATRSDRHSPAHRIPFWIRQPLRPGSRIDLGATFDQRDVLVAQEVRLPRVLVGALVRAALGISGAAMQGVFATRSPSPA